MRAAIFKYAIVCFEALLLVPPPRFRATYGNEMVWLFRCRLERAARRSLAGLLFCATAGLVDLAMTGVLQRFSERRASHVPRLPAPTGDPMMNRIALNMKLTVRNMMRTPGFTVTVLTTLALGTGATIAMFAVTDATLLRPLPYPNSHRLVAVQNVDESMRRDAFGLPYLRDLRSRIHSLDRIAGYSPSWSQTVTGAGEPRNVTSAYITDDLFELLGVTAVTGRTFTSEEYASRTNRVTVVSRAFWNRHFGRDVSLNGQVIRLGDQPHSIVGIIEQDFRLPQTQSAVSSDVSNAELWLPFSLNRYADLRSIPVMNIVGRLAPDATAAAMNRELQVVAASLAADYPETSRGRTLASEALQDLLTRPIERTVLVLFGAVSFLLLIACGNVANLLLARGNARQFELAVRRSLGATRRVIIEQLFVETFVVAAAGCALGLLIAGWAVASIPSLGLKGLPPTVDVRIDWRAGAFTAIVAAVVTGLFGLIPALKLSRNEQGNLRNGARTTEFGGQRLRDMLIISEVALTLTLLVGAGLLARSFWKLSHVNPGFHPENVLAIPISLSGTMYGTDELRESFYREAIARLQELPGARTVAAVNRAPLSGGNVLVPVEIEGKAGQVTVDRRVATPDYFATAGIPLVEGRDFTSEDQPQTEPSAILNRTAALQFWPDGHAVGRRLRLIQRNGPGPWVRVVGITGDIRHHGLDRAIQPEVYVPYLQAAVESMVVVVRTGVPPETITGAARNAIWSLDRNLPVDQTQPLDQFVNASLEEPRIRMAFLNGFAAFALLLAGVGLYGVVSYSISRRRREIGIRVALGATPAQIVQHIVWRGLLLATIGSAAGLAASALASKALAGLLFGVTPTDTPTLIGVTVLVLFICGIASFVPARRVTGFEPSDVLKGD
jgi:predicted permease